MLRTHHDLKAWSLSRALVKDVYRLTAGFPDDERFGLTAQLRRASVSIPSNIAEGAARNSSREFRRFIAMARGSLAEVETQIILASDLDYVGDTHSLDAKIEELFRILGGLLNSDRR